MTRHDSLKHTNRLLVVIILGINIYLLGAPLWPQVEYWFNKRSTSAVHGLPYKTDAPGEAALNGNRSNIPSDNRLVIPAMALNTPILSGDNPKTVNKGVWALPSTSTPPEGGNTVLAGHRFSYRGAPSLYHLDKVKMGDIVSVYWQGNEYVYKVTDKKVVPASAVEIEDPTEDSRLTIYTCTPLWNVKDRLVIVATLMEGPNNE